MRSRAGASNKSKKTATALSKRTEEEAQPLFLNCAHFDKLVRIHVMLALTAGDAYKQKEYALDGHFFLGKLWEQTIQSLNGFAFYQEHKAEVEALGFNCADPEQRKAYFTEVFTNPEVVIP